MRAALPPRRIAYERAEVARAVASVAPVIELCDTRLENWKAARIEEIIADNGFHGGLVVGTAVNEWGEPRSGRTRSRALDRRRGARSWRERRRARSSARRSRVWIANGELRGAATVLARVISLRPAPGPDCISSASRRRSSPISWFVSAGSKSACARLKILESQGLRTKEAKTMEAISDPG